MRVVQRIARHQKTHQLAFQGIAPLGRRRPFRVGEFAHLGVAVVTHLRETGELLASRAPTAEGVGQRLQLRVFLRQAPEAGLITDHIGVGQFAADLVTAFDQSFEFGKQAGLHRNRGSGRLGTTQRARHG